MSASVTGDPHVGNTKSSNFFPTLIIIALSQEKVLIHPEK